MLDAHYWLEFMRVLFRSAIAERAERTSGAVYDHFGGKDGLLFALLESWVDDVAVVIVAELATATTIDERVASLWRNVSDPPTGGGRWLALEHELWSYARSEEHPSELQSLMRISYAVFCLKKKNKKTKTKYSQ